MRTYSKQLEKINRINKKAHFCLLESLKQRWDFSPMAGILETILAPLELFREWGLSPIQVIIVVGMLVSGALAQWLVFHRFHFSLLHLNVVI